MQVLPTSRDTIAPMRHARWAGSPWPAPVSMRPREGKERRYHRLLDQGRTLGYAVTLPQHPPLGSILIECGWLPQTTPPDAALAVLRRGCAAQEAVVRSDDPWSAWWSRQGLSAAWRREVFATPPGMTITDEVRHGRDALTPLDGASMAAALRILGQGPALTPRGGELPEWRLRDMAEHGQALTVRNDDTVRVVALWESLAAQWAVIRVLVAPECHQQGRGAAAARLLTEHLARRGRRVMALVEPHDESARKLACAAGMSPVLEEIGYALPRP